jgi:hypothetical protein
MIGDKRRCRDLSKPYQGIHPASVADDTTALLGVLLDEKFTAPSQQLFYRLSASRLRIGEVVAPRVDVGLGNLRPGSPIPIAKIQLTQTRIHAVGPTPTAQYASNVKTTSQR